jgi:hypothetical protein
VSDQVVPPGWPATVRPPGSPDWERSASAWLFDLCPPDYRGYDVFRRHPVVLALVARQHLQVGIEAARNGLATAREELSRLVDVPTVEATVAAYEREGARLLAAARAVALVERALRGGRFIRRL